MKERTLFAKDMKESWSVLLTLPLVGNFCCERVFVTAVAAGETIRWIYCSNRTLSIKKYSFLLYSVRWFKNGNVTGEAVINGLDRY